MKFREAVNPDAQVGSGEKEIAMSSGNPVIPEDRRVIPFRSAPASTAASSHPQPPSPTPQRIPPESPVEVGRHYLKFMLPSIPIATFILSFVYCSLLVGAAQPRNTTTGPHAPLANPALPWLGALLLGLTTGALCMLIYFGYQRVTRRTPTPDGA